MPIVAVPCRATAQPKSVPSWLDAEREATDDSRSVDTRADVCGCRASRHEEAASDAPAMIGTALLLMALAAPVAAAPPDGSRRASTIAFPDEERGLVILVNTTRAGLLHPGCGPPGSWPSSDGKPITTLGSAGRRRSDPSRRSLP